MESAQLQDGCGLGALLTRCGHLDEATGQEEVYAGQPPIGQKTYFTGRVSQVFPTSLSLHLFACHECPVRRRSQASA